MAFGGIKNKVDVVASLNLTGFENLSGVETNKPPHQYFSNLFNAYSKAINKRNGFRGPLFERPFKRKLIDNEEYLKNVLIYIHNNPVHHKFCEHAMDYPWSSYLTCMSSKLTKLKRNAVLSWFDNAANFKCMHEKKTDIEAIDKWLGME